MKYNNRVALPLYGRKIGEEKSDQRDYTTNARGFA